VLDVSSRPHRVEQAGRLSQFSLFYDGAGGGLQSVTRIVEPSGESDGDGKWETLRTYGAETRDELDRWCVPACDTLRLHSRVLRATQFSDVRQGFEGLRCLDLAWDKFVPYSRMHAPGGGVVAWIIADFERLEVLRVSLFSMKSDEILRTARFREAAALAPGLSFFRNLRDSGSLRSLHVDVLDLSTYECTSAPESYDFASAGRDLSNLLTNIRHLEELQVNCPVTRNGFVTPDGWGETQRIAVSGLQGLRRVSSADEERRRTTNVFVDWATLFSNGGVTVL
jgi:hypothetical protein